ncbi:hypothetical protein [Fischerella sp. JS2]|uniref:hypothetical protein n=1 Tax=Fischerella sp. JS2 TaxID=2597771 RepID=UPI0028E48852|nr:hypothetical protein [Fischerella sp. JS2]
MFLKIFKQFVTSGLPGKILKEKFSLRKQQNKRLQEDVKSVLSYREWIQSLTNNTFDCTRIIGVVAAATGAENYLPYTIPKIIAQISEIGMMADIVIGMNNGYESQSVVDRFSLLPNVQVVCLYTSDKLANNIPAKIYDNFRYEGKPYYLKNIDSRDCKHRIFIVHQKEGEYAAGKIRVLGDIYESLLLKSIENGWIPPKILIAFDAESQFLVEQNYAFIEPASNGLMLMVRELEKHPKIDILGTRNRFAIYQKYIVDETKVLLPNFSEEVPPLQWFLNIVHGKYKGFKWMPGGGTAGKIDAMISLLVVISQRYPGTRSEDTHLTILAKYAGFIGDIFLDVVSTNRTPNFTDMTIDKSPKKAWIEQIFRWNAGCQGLILCYGKHNVRLIAADCFPWSIFSSPIEFLKRLKGTEKLTLYTISQKLRILAIAFFVSRNIRNRSLENPDILQGSKVKASW